MTNEEKQLKLALEGECNIELFGNKEIRRILHDKEWWFSLNDILESLLDVSDGSAYARKIKERDEGLKQGWDQIVTPLPFETTGGKQLINFVNIQGIFRIMQSVPSPKADPFKKWLAKVGFERVQEFENPELAIKRAIAIYHAKGYPPEWIDARIPNKIARERLEEHWSKNGIKAGVEFAILTNAISEETFGIDTQQHKSIKNIGKSHNLRDNMTPLELTLTTLAEQATKAIAESSQAKNLYAHKLAAKSGGSIAGEARASIESATGKKVVSAANYLTEQQRKNIQISENMTNAMETAKRIAKVPKPKSK